MVISDLHTEKTKILTYLKQEGFCAFFGFFEENSPGTIKTERPSRVFWDDKAASGWQGFLQTAKTVGVRMVYMDEWIFEDEDLQEAQLEAQLDEREIESYRKYVGEPRGLSLSWFFGGLRHDLKITTKWHETFEDLSEPKGVDEDDEEEDREPSEEELVKYSRQVAEDPRFHRAKTKGIRLSIVMLPIFQAGTKRV